MAGLARTSPLLSSRGDSVTSAAMLKTALFPLIPLSLGGKHIKYTSSKTNRVTTFRIATIGTPCLGTSR